MDNTLELEQSFLPPSELTEQDVTGMIEEVMVTAPRGYADGGGHDMLADTHKALAKSLGNEVPEGYDFKEMTRSLQRNSLKLSLSLDAKSVLEGAALDAVTAAADAASLLNIEDQQAKEVLGWGLARAAKKALVAPEEAAVEAITALEAPYTISEATRDALVMGDLQVLSVNKRTKDHPILDFSFDNYVADFAAHVAVPIRQSIGIAKAGDVLPDAELKGYFDTLKQWKSMSARDQKAIWDTVENGLWKAAGGNVLVYGALVMPFIYEESEFWTEIAPIWDAADTLVAYGTLRRALFHPVRTYGNLKILSKISKANYRSLRRGNVEAATEATVAAIKNKSSDAVKEGSPVNFAAGDKGLVAGLSGAVQTSIHQMKLYQKAVEQGLIDAGEDLFVNLKILRDMEVDEVVQGLEKTILTDGRVILDRTMGEGTVTFKVEYPTDLKVPVTDLVAMRTKLGAELKDLRTRLQKVLSLKGVGEDVAEKEALTAQIKAKKEQITSVTSALKDAKKMETSSGVTITKLAVPGVSPKGKAVGELTYIFNVDDATGFGKFSLINKDDVSLYAGTIGTQEAALGHIANDLASRATFARQQQRRVFGLFDKELRKIRGRLGIFQRMISLGETSRGHVAALLQHGDEVQVSRFKDSDLLSGIKVEGLGYHQFTPREVEVYNEVRDLYDDLWTVANNLRVRELEFGGYSQFNIKIVDPKDPKKISVVSAYGKANESSILGYVPTVRGGKILRAVDLDSGQVVDLSKVTDINKKLSEGKLGFVKLKEEVKIGKESYDFGIGQVSAVSGIKTVKAARRVGPVALEYRPGYVPKIPNERISHVVVSKGKIIKNGVKVDDAPKLVRAFKSDREAHIFVQRWADKHPTKPLPTVESLSSLRTHKNPDYVELAEHIDERLFRGAFVGHREEKSRFLVGLMGEQPKRVDPFESLQRYADFVGTNYPIHEWKQAQIKRFIEMARKTDIRGNAIKDQSWLEVPTRWDSAIGEAAPNYRELRALQENMRVVFAVPSSAESIFTKAQHHIVRSLDSVLWDVDKGKARFGPATSKGLTSLRDFAATSQVVAHPFEAAKRTTFTLMLTMLNIRQFFVQSAGMRIPFGLHPVEGAAALPDFLFLRFAQAFGNDVKGFSQYAKGVGLDPKEMEVMIRAWHKSGIPDSILENADYGYFQGAHGAYYSAPLMHELVKRGRFFYDSGELNNRALGFVMAFKRKAKQHEWDLKKPLTDAQLVEVNQEALRLGTNMGPANAAKWQNMPVIGLKTQFWQQTHKFYENLWYTVAHGVNKNVKKENMWTGKEAASIAITELMLGGLAAYGIDEMWTGLDRWMFDPEGLGLDPAIPAHRQMITQIRGGLTELATLHGLGYTLDVTDSLAPGSGAEMIYEAIKEWLYLGVNSFAGMEVDFTADMVIGASANIGTRFGSAFSKTLQALLGKRGEVDDMDDALLTGVLTEVWQITSTGNNLERAMAWQAANDITDKNGKRFNIISEGEVIPASTVIAKLSGFDPLALEAQYTAVKRDKRDAAKVSAATKSIEASLRTQYREIGRAGDDGRQAIANGVIAFWRKALPQTLFNKAMYNALDNLRKEELDDFPIKMYKKFYELDTGSEAAKEAWYNAKVFEYYHNELKENAK